MILVALVDHRYRFRFTNVGSPGWCHSLFAYQRLDLACHVNGPLLQTPVANISGMAVPPLILCDQAFPLTPNLIKPFSHRSQLDDGQRRFNYELSKSRRIKCVWTDEGKVSVLAETHGVRLRICKARHSCMLHSE